MFKVSSLNLNEKKGYMYTVIREYNSVKKRIRIIYIYGTYKLQVAHAWIDPWTSRPRWGNWSSLLEDKELTKQMQEQFEGMTQLRLIRGI